mmetsp:Transcript_23712/g.58661  ORF Transcript_23712/g.58661 Transcript_23712/m.58661 type:complete len:91 (+) Transcript_23712:550-822(+)
MGHVCVCMPTWRVSSIVCDKFVKMVPCGLLALAPALLAGCCAPVVLNDCHGLTTLMDVMMHWTGWHWCAQCVPVLPIWARRPEVLESCSI